MTTLAELEQQKNVLEQKINLIKREERKQLPPPCTEQKKQQQEEFYRQQKAGLNPEKLVPHIDLESIVGSSQYESILNAENVSDIHESTLRSITLQYKTPNRRALWQSVGQEYIEPELLDFIDNMKTGDTYFDVGSSTGVFSIYAAAKGIETVCFEPEVQNFNLLNFNSYLNRKQIDGNINNFNIALSDTDGVSNMYISKFEEAGHLKILGKPLARGSSKEFPAEFKQSVFTLRFDTFIELTEMALPTHLKIDIDGSEGKFIKGMGNCLSNKRIQYVFIEILENNTESEETLESLKNAGFIIEKKIRVQNYFGEHNYILRRK